MNTKILLISLAAVAGAVLLFAGQTTDSGVSDSLGLTRFANFQQKFSKRYESPAEAEYRLGVFQANFELIEAHNADASATYTLELNEFADLTFDEFSAKYLGVAEDFEAGAAKCERSSTNKFDPEPPKEVCWVKAGVVHPVKNQAACGSCWAFSAVGALESALAIFKGQKNLCISEQELVDCSRKYGNGGCNGGLMHLAYDYILDKGINDSKDYPYTARDGTCKADKSGKGPHHIKGCKQVARGVQNIIKDLVAQPVAVAFYVQNDFRFYKKGVYNPKGCTSRPNHAVLAVGYNLEGEETNGEKIPYFGIKNSWGTSWGDQGYFKMAIGKGSGTCSLAAHDWNYVPTV